MSAEDIARGKAAVESGKYATTASPNGPVGTIPSRTETLHGRAEFAADEPPLQEPDEPYDPGPAPADDEPPPRSRRREKPDRDEPPPHWLPDGDNPAGWHGQNGAQFILERPNTVPAQWGRGDDVAWSEGESLMIAGGMGVCKTTLAGQLVRAQIGAGEPTVLGLPVQPVNRVLYLAMDRPRQIARSLARQFTADDRAVLAERLVVRTGPPPADLARNPTLLARMADYYRADAVYVDSLKDAAIGLSDDEVGAGYNRARQHLLASGAQLCDLHHNRKPAAGAAPPKSVADVYGSTWLTSGCGSVIGLSGEPGDPVIELAHLKPPVDSVGPWTLLHSPDLGELSIFHEVDLVALVEAKALTGVTAADAAKALFSTDTPGKAQVERARRKLDGKVKDGVLVCQEGQRGGDPARWFLAP